MASDDEGREGRGGRRRDETERRHSDRRDHDDDDREHRKRPRDGDDRATGEGSAEKRARRREPSSRSDDRDASGGFQVQESGGEVSMSVEETNR